MIRPCFFKKPRAFSLPELLAAVTITAVIIGLSALVITTMADTGQAARDTARATREAARVFQQIQIDWENRVNGGDIAVILENPQAPGEPWLQIIAHGPSAESHRFPVSAGEPPAGFRTIAWRCATPGLERGLAGFGRHDRFAGLMPPPGLSYAQITAQPPDAPPLDTADWQPVPLQNWPVPETHFEPAGTGIVTVGLSFQLAEPCRINGTDYPPGSVLRDPPLLPQIGGGRPQLVDLSKIGAVHIALVIARESSLAQASPQQWQNLAQTLQDELAAAEGNLTAYHVWQPLLENPDRLPEDLPPNVTGGLRVFQQVYRVH